MVKWQTGWVNETDNIYQLSDDWTPCWKQLTENIFTTKVAPTGVNIGLVVGSTRAALIDTGHSPHQGSLLVESATELVCVPVDTLILTHGDYDHSFGVGGASEKIQNFGHTPHIFAHENWLKDATNSEANHFALTNQLNIEQCTKTDPAPNLIALIHYLNLGNCPIELTHLATGHSASDLVIYLPDSNIIFAGDLLESAGDPVFTQNTVVDKWPQALKAVFSVANENTVIIPGHGDPVDQVFALNQRNHIEAIWSQVGWLVENGIWAETALERVAEDIAEGFWPPLSVETLSTAIPIAYQQYRKSNSGPGKQLPIVQSR